MVSPSDPSIPFAFSCVLLNVNKMSKYHTGSTEEQCRNLDVLFREKGDGQIQLVIILYGYDFFTQFDGETFIWYFLLISV